MEYELRVYTIKPGRLDQFVEEWRAQVLPLRRRLGFDVRGAWTVPEEDLFVWLVGADELARRDAAYYESAERAALEPDPARLVAVPRHWRLKPVL